MAKTKMNFKDKYNKLDDCSKKELLEKTIRSKCIECCAGSKKEASLCVIPTCPLSKFIFFVQDN